MIFLFKFFELLKFKLSTAVWNWWLQFLSKIGFGVTLIIKWLLNSNDRIQLKFFIMWVYICFCYVHNIYNYFLLEKSLKLLNKLCQSEGFLLRRLNEIFFIWSMNRFYSFFWWQNKIFLNSVPSYCTNNGFKLTYLNVPSEVQPRANDPFFVHSRYRKILILEICIHFCELCISVQSSGSLYCMIHVGFSHFSIIEYK